MEFLHVVEGMSGTGWLICFTERSERKPVFEFLWRSTMSVQGASLNATPRSVLADVQTGQLEKPVSSWGDVEMGRHLLNKFDKFSDPKNKEYITRNSLLDAAYPRRNSSFTPADSTFARELLSRHELMDKLDADSRGKLDEKIDRTNIKLVIQGGDVPRSSEVKNQSPVTAVASGEHKSIQAWSDLDLTRYLVDNFKPLDNSSYDISSTERVFNGVASGNNQYNNIDPVLKSVVSEIMSRPKLRSMIFSGPMSNGQRTVTPQHLKTLVSGALLTHEMGDPGRFKGLSDVGMAKHLLDNMPGFSGRLSVSRAELLDAATMKNPDINAEQAAFARELLSRPALFEALDNDGRGGRDNIIGIETVRALSRKPSSHVSVSASPDGLPSDWNDYAVMKHLLKGFHIFVDPEAKPFITRAHLEKIANSPTDADYSAADINVARELLNRNAVFNILDRDDDGKLDGKIGDKTILDALTVRVTQDARSKRVYGQNDEVLESWTYRIYSFDSEWTRD